MDRLRLAIILEAAGNSRRFGSNKLLHIMNDGEPMVSHIISAVSEVRRYYADIQYQRIGAASRCEVGTDLILVTQYEEVADLARRSGEDFTIVMNSSPELGISHSMQLGIGAADGAGAYMFCVCDQPWLTADTIIRMISEYYRACCGDQHDDPQAYADESCDQGTCSIRNDGPVNMTAPIVTLSWQGTMYSPKIFSSYYRDELMQLEGDTGGRQILAHHRDSILCTEASFAEETMDIDADDPAARTISDESRLHHDSVR